jgi:hypothetical protein
MKLGPNLTYITATILNGAALSDTIDTQGFPLVGIRMPAAWTAANLTFKSDPAAAASVADVYDEAGTEVVVTAAAARFIQIPASKLTGVRFLQVRSGTTGTPVNQGGDRTLQLVIREV